MRASTIVLTTLLVSTSSVGGFLIHRQRQAIGEMMGNNAALSKEIDQRGVTINDREKEIDSIKERLAKEQAARAIEQRQLAELAELQKERDQAKARADQLASRVDSLLGKFKHLIDTGKLAIEVRHGRLALVLPNDILFDEAKAEIKPQGQAALTEIAATLKTVKDRQFEVIGHTDSTPIKSADFPSNWELSTARSLAVVKLLVDAGVPGGMLAATGRGEYEPRAPNGNAWGRQKNRRIEIVLEPAVGDIVKLASLKM